MIGLDGEDGAGGGEDVLVGDQAGAAGVGGDADILEDKGAEEEADVVGERVEGLAGGDEAGGEGEIGEGVGEIDGGPGDGGGAEGGAQEIDVVRLIDGEALGRRPGWRR